MRYLKKILIMKQRVDKHKHHYMVQLKDLLGTLDLCSGIHTKIFQDHIQFFDLIPLDGNIYNQVGMLTNIKNFVIKYSMYTNPKKKRKEILCHI